MQHADDFAETDPATADRSVPAGGPRTLAIRFAGSGSEYFRIWIVNLLLTLLTFTLYWPFARARRMAYFQNNTLVGKDPLGFHADPWKMFRGYCLVLVLGLAYWAVTNFLPALAWLALLVLAALWPLLWRASLQFRLRNTSWRGVRLAFLGDTRSAYMVMLPFFVPGLALLLLAPAGDPGTQEAAAAPVYGAIATGVVMLGFALLLPWLLLRIKQYQHGGYAFAQERTGLHAGAGAFYRLYAKAGGVTMGCVLLVMALMAALFFLVQGLRESVGALAPRAGAAGGAAIALMGLVGLLYLMVPLVSLPYATARFQDLLWSNTRSEHIRFESRLRFRDVLRVNLVNWLLLVVALGLFWPFAKVRTARLRLEAMAVLVSGDMDGWVALGQTAGQGILGDAAGDFLGIDMGL